MNITLSAIKYQRSDSLTHNVEAYTQGFYLSSPDNDKTSKKPLNNRAMEELKLLIESYKNRIKTLKTMKGMDAIADTRLRTKGSCFRTILSELERVLANVSTSEKDLRVCEVIASASEWKYVGDELPGEEDFFLCLCLGYVPFVGYFTKIDNKFRLDGSFYAVTHWMPLPIQPA